jgi:hypothetical protein
MYRLFLLIRESLMGYPRNVRNVIRLIVEKLRKDLF